MKARLLPFAAGVAEQTVRGSSRIGADMPLFADPAAYLSMPAQIAAKGGRGTIARMDPAALSERGAQ